MTELILIFLFLQLLYLRKKMLSNENKETGVTPRDDTIWKKIFRDLREFYRILFKSRFHPLDYKTSEQADTWCKTLLEELGIDTKNLTPYNLRKTFYFFHQTRLNSSDHYSSDYMHLKIWLFNLHQLRTWCIWKSDYTIWISPLKNWLRVIGFPNTPCA